MHHQSQARTPTTLARSTDLRPARPAFSARPIIGRLGVLGTLGLLLAASSPTRAQGDQSNCRRIPSWDNVASYGVIHYSDDSCAILQEGEYPQLPGAAKPIDRIAPYGDTKIVGCTEPTFGGVCKDYTPDDTALHSPRLGSARVGRRSVRLAPASAEHGRLPLAAPLSFERGRRYPAEAGGHVLTFQPDGNFVVSRADGGYVWGFDRLPSLDLGRVARVDWQADGNLAAYDATGQYLWSALTENPDPSARLVLQPNGALQIVSPTRGVLWSSDGNRSAPSASGTGTRLNVPSGQPLERGRRYEAGTYALTHQPDGNLVVSRADGGYVWGFDQLPGLDLGRIGAVTWQPDGNLVARDASGGYMWSALTENPDPAASLNIDPQRGALQIVSPSRGVLWASDENQTSPIGPAPRPAPEPQPQTEPQTPAETSGTGFPFVAGQTIARGSAFTSASGLYDLTLQEGGNLVISTIGGGYRWGFDGQRGLDYRQVDRVRVQEDGNFVALNAAGRVIWRAVPSNPDPASQLVMDDRGALQLVSPTRGVLWSSDGMLAPSIDVFAKAAPVTACTPEEGWAKCVALIDPDMTIQGTGRVTDSAMNAIANVYAEITARLTDRYPRSRFDGFKVYITNGESEAELTALPTVNTMWTPGYGPQSRAHLRGGAAGRAGEAVHLWISEQMVCKTGVATRQADFRAGRASESDESARTFDQVVHEFGHSIDQEFNLRATRLGTLYRGNPTEPFAQSVQSFFGVPVQEQTAVQTSFQNELFSSRVGFSCDGYTP